MPIHETMIPWLSISLTARVTSFLSVLARGFMLIRQLCVPSEFVVLLFTSGKCHHFIVVTQSLS